MASDMQKIQRGGGGGGLNNAFIVAPIEAPRPDVVHVRWVASHSWTVPVLRSSSSGLLSLLRLLSCAAPWLTLLGLLPRRLFAPGTDGRQGRMLGPP